MSVTNLLEYPVDIAKGIGEENLQATSKQFENRGWKTISWGVDSHDALEFTIYRLEDERDVYVSLFLAISEKGTIEYALEALIEIGGHGRLIRIDSGTKDIFRAEDITTLLDQATARLEALEPLPTPLLAALGAADLALATANDLVAELRERAEETRTETRSRVEERRARLAKLQEDLPEQLTELRGRFTPEELRKAAESYLEAATSRYNELVERGEATLERLRSQSGFEDASARAEGYVDQAVELTQEALGTVASQTRAVSERAAKLVGIELPKKAPAKKVPAKKATAKKAPAKKAPAKMATKKVTQK